MIARPRTLLAVVAALLVVPAAASAQLEVSLGAGGVGAHGDFENFADYGFTVRSQVSMRIPGVSFLGVQAGGGWTSMRNAILGALNQFGFSADSGNFNFYQVGAGARAYLGPLFVGANGMYFIGDTDEGVGFVPEIGINFWKLDFVVDHRIDGDLPWWAARLDFRF